MNDRRPPGVSVICVSNDVEVLNACLLKSLADIERLPMEVIVLDNRAGEFSSAGAAFNHASALARYDVGCFVHQDVVVHVPGRLLAAADIIRTDDRIGLLGAIGPRPGGLSGLIRDRLMLLGEAAPTPTLVDSVDEVLMMAPLTGPRALPWAADEDFAWHLYGAEYGVRARQAGRSVVAVDMAITHHSMSINLARLDEAHAALARRHPAALPLRTTTGTIGTLPPPGARIRARTLAGRLRRWLIALGPASAVTPHPDHVLIADVREDVDRWSGEGRVRVLNLDHTGSFSGSVDGVLTLSRGDRAFAMEAFSNFADLVAQWEAPHGGAALATNLSLAQALHLRSATGEVEVRRLGSMYWVARGLQPPTAA